MTVFRVIAPSLACLGLLACGGPDELDTITNPAPCPTASVLFDAARIVQFDGPQEIENVRFTGEIIGVRALCRYDSEGGPIEVDMEIDFALGRGQAAPTADTTYGYFIAVTRRDSVVLAKQSFGLDAEFGNDSIVYETAELEGLMIPRRDGNVSGANFEIIVGFELNADELAFNRSGVRFRPDAGAFETPAGG